MRIAVIGGGISGLAAAHRLRELAAETSQSIGITLFEGSQRLGGSVSTVRRGDYLVECGADSFITNKPWAINLCRRLGLEDRLIPTDERFRRSLVLHRGQPVPVPDGFTLLTPSRVLPVLTSPLLSWRGKLRMGLEVFVPRKLDSEDESLADFVRRRFGQELLDRIVQPLVGGIYTSDPERLSLRATMPRFLDMERNNRSLILASRRTQAPRDIGTGARYGLFATLRGGLGELIEALESRLRCGVVSATQDSAMPPVDIRLSTSVRSILSAGEVESAGVPRRSFTLNCHDGTTEVFDRVVLACRANDTARLLASTDAEVARLLTDIPYASSAIVVTGHRLADFRHPLDAFGLVIPAIERRKTLAVSFSSRKFPERAPDRHVLLRTFVGGAMQPELMQLSDEEMTSLVLRELRDVLGMQGSPEFSLVTRYIEAMPQYHVGHLDRVGRIDERMANLPGLELAGNAYHGVGIPDCVHSGEQAAERLIRT